jgi:hypothetical protein
MPLLELDGLTAWNNIYAEKGLSRWPQQGSPRMEPIAHPQFRPSFKIQPGAKIFTLGSCFARNIEQHLAQHGFDVPSHKYFGTSHLINKYNPFSILQEIRGTFNSDLRIPSKARLVEVKDGLWVDLHLHVNQPMPKMALIKANNDCQKFFNEIKNCAYFIITLGLIEVWYDLENECYVNEPLNFEKVYLEDEKLRKHFAERFVFRVLDFSETYSATYEIFSLLKNNCIDNTKAILTVSPVALSGSFTGKDVLIANAHSKSALRTVAEEVCARFDFVDYFPSYESVTLSPRHTAWEQDGIHVTDEVVAVNVRRMVEAYLEQA